MKPTRLLIIDDHRDVREALKDRLDATPAIEVVGCTGRWEAGLRTALDLEPEVVLLETKRADADGLRALTRLTEACERTEVVVLTSYADTEERAEAVSRGAVRYLLKDIDTDQLVREIQSLTQK
ncbi:MAG: response regulator [Anaerolineae bacterium]|jgi:DNA-binding NarL/FixJ family response regulator